MRGVLFRPSLPALGAVALGWLVTLGGCGGPERTPDSGAQVDAAEPTPMDAGPEDGGPEPDAGPATFDAGFTRSMRVLFVGNSYTYVNDLPQVVTELAAASGILLEAEVIAMGGAKLCDHFSAMETRARMASGEHDAVVIQGQSVDMFYDGESTYFCGENMGYSVRDAGAQTVWFATWARREGDEFYSRGRGVTTPAEMTDHIDRWYRNLGQWGPGGHVARVGRAWERVLARVPEVELHDTDGSHPSPAGTFVAAVVLAQGLFGEAPAVPSPAPFGLDVSLAETLRDVAVEAPCFDELQFCGGECLSVAFDPLHCGACDAACGTPRECLRGVCDCAPVSAWPTTFEALAALDPACAATARATLGCEVAAHLACRDQPCGGSGFGPVTSATGDLEVMCTSANIVPATYTELATHHPSCDGVTERHGLACRTAAHRLCVARGAAAGFGPVSRRAGDDVDIACLDDAEVRVMPDAAIIAWGCEGYPDRAWDEVCDGALNRMCVMMGWSGGYGPLESATGATGTVELVCISG